MAAAGADVPQTAGGGAGTLRFTFVPPATLLAFKVVPGTVISNGTLTGQTAPDWSATYAQVSIQHAVSYLANHYDRGHSEASLVAVTTRRELPVCVCVSDGLKDSGVGAAATSRLLRQATAEHGQELGEGKLMKVFGDRLGKCLITYDADEMEVMLPHQLMTLDNFHVQPLCTFVRDERQPWATLSVQGLDQSFVLLKEDRHDAVRLGHRLASVIAPNTAKAVLKMFSQGSSCNSTKVVCAASILDSLSMSG